MRILVTPDYQTLSQTAADLVLEAIRAKPDLTLGLPTGATPQGMYDELVRRYHDERLNFSRLRTFNLDEYVGLLRNHPRSYYTYMRRRLFDHVNIAAENIHIPDGSPGIDPDAESARYESAIRAAGGIDLLVAGIGTNGHVAFNEPGSPPESRTRFVTLATETRRIAQQYFDNEEVPQYAITMGIGTLLEARRILILASGASKSDAVQRALKGPVSSQVPASAVQLHAQVIAILDQAAAAKI
jgi:glucosamine-6-phosphate deaminase